MVQWDKPMDMVAGLLGNLLNYKNSQCQSLGQALAEHEIIRLIF